jgi:ribulose-bisphosphate carboxylase small chain
MKTLPIERRYETLSYLPPLSDQQIARQIQYMLEQGFIPGVEFNSESTGNENSKFYWTMWKLPLFNCTSTQDVLNEVRECRTEYPNSYIKVVGFDNIKQCQTVSFIVHKPTRY